MSPARERTQSSLLQSSPLFARFAVILLSLVTAAAQSPPTPRSAMQELIRGAGLQKAGQFEASLAIFDSILSRNDLDHDLTGRTLLFKGISDQDLGRLNDAERAFEEAASTFVALPDRRREHAAALNNLGSVYQQLGRSDEACSLRKQALATFRDLGDIEGVVRADNNLAITELQRHKTREARVYLADAFARRASAPGLTQDDLAALYSTAGLLAAHDHKPLDSLANYRHAFDLWFATYGEQHFATARAHLLRGGAYLSLGNFDSALDDLGKGLATLEHTVGKNTDLFISGQLTYAAALKGAGREAEARDVNRAAIAALAEVRRHQCTDCTVNIAALR